MRTARALLVCMSVALLAGTAPALAATIHLRASLDGAPLALPAAMKGDLHRIEAIGAWTGALA